MGEPVKSTETSKSGSVTSLKKTGAAPAQYFNPFTDFDRLFDEFLPRGWMRPLRDLSTFPSVAQLEAKLPRIDVVDRDNEISVRAELPGVAKDDIDISVGDNTLTIKGETKHEEKEEKGNYYRCEISRGAFARTIALPAAVDAERAKAAFKDGILELTLPKVETSKRRTVKVE